MATRGLAGSLMIALALGCAAGAAAPLPALPDATIDDALASAPGKATLVVAGGCFWGIEEVFQHVRGVTDAVAGYAGGSARDADYERVSSGATGHAESVRITYDPSQISMGQLLKIFFSVAHDPTQRGGQGPDVGPQYRSAVFYADARQEEIVRAYVRQLTEAHAFKRAITTEMVPLAAFYAAEAYHQDFARKNPRHPYIVYNDLPKVDALRKQFSVLYVK